MSKTDTTETTTLIELTLHDTREPVFILSSAITLILQYDGSELQPMQQGPGRRTRIETRQSAFIVAESAEHVKRLLSS